MNELALEKELNRFFIKLKKEVLDALKEYWSEYQMLQGQINLIVSPVHEAHREYFEILKKYKTKEYRLGVEEATRLVKNVNKNRVALKTAQTLSINGFIKKDKYDLFGTLPDAEKDLLNRTFRTSEQTLNRVDSQLNKIISDGYRSGYGINKVAGEVTRRFGQLATWEARRIARTEINTSHNVATVNTYQDLGVEYTQWIAANDDRTRDSHVEVDGEIIPMGGTYSNGLGYPGDMSGPLEEWINCRCSNAPFVIPFGYMAPSFSPFREDDLIPIENQQNPLEQLQQQTAEPQTIMPTNEQLKANLTKQELEIVEWAKRVQTSETVTNRGKAKARQQLEELYAKALKKPTPKAEKVPPQTVEAKPLQSKVKTVEKQPVQPKVSENDKINRMTSNELYESMTKADKKKYDKAKKSLENGRKYNYKPLIEDGLLKIRELEQKQRDKLKNKGKRKPKTKPAPSPYERTLDDIHKDIDLPTEALISKMEKWIDKRCTNAIEYGYHFDVKTGKLVNKEIRGKKGRVTIQDKGAEYGSIHSHPTNGMAPPSAEDLITFRCKGEKHHFMPSKHEVWYVEATESLGPLGKLAQLDLQEAHANCVLKAKEKVAKEIKEGKLKADRESIAMALDRYVGDELLDTFNKPPWSDKLTIRRYYR